MIQPDSCKQYRDEGWKFYYDPDTRFVGVKHPRGGHQSVVEMKFSGLSGLDADEIGHAIASMLNGPAVCSVVSDAEFGS